MNTKNKYLYLYFQKNIKIKQQQNSSWKNASLIKKYIYIQIALLKKIKFLKRLKSYKLPKKNQKEKYSKQNSICKNES